mmetsp:Transcript_37808/g.93596  ORF Transcript_37808/g.93596 Transcript_37808/m.93596 type:complete len:95 (-) Transcript_37808:158-442(-)
MVTLLGGLAAVGLDYTMVAQELQTLCGASAAVEETPCANSPPRLDVMVQGLWNLAIVEHLFSAHGVPAHVVQDKAAAGKLKQKKEKACTNVRRA